MKQWNNFWLLGAGIGATLGALLHLAIPIGGPDWYAWSGAPLGIVRMAQAGAWYPLICCIAIASLALLCAAYAFAGAGLLRRPPLLRTGLLGIAAVCMLRGLLFIPLIVWRPGSLLRICNCTNVDTFIVVSSLLWFALGLAYALGARRLFARQDTNPADPRS